jgi:cytochrome b561
MLRTRYDALTQILHWVIALAVVAAYAIGLIREDLPKTDFRAWLLLLHMSIGLSILALTVLRVLWRGAVAGPAPISEGLSLLVVKAGHLALYGALFLIPLIGLFAAWYKGRVFGFFDLVPLPSPVATNKDLAEKLEEIHGLAAHGIMILAGGHALLAIVHQWVMKDGTLGRMLPFLAATPDRHAAE